MMQEIKTKPVKNTGIKSFKNTEALKKIGDRHMKNKFILRVAAICMAIIMASAPVDVYASSVLKVGSRGTKVVLLQTTLQKLGYFTYPKLTGYYGGITKLAVKRFQKDNGIMADGIVGKTTLKLMLPDMTSLSASAVSMATFDSLPTYSGDLDWFTQVSDIWKRGMDAVVTDVDTGKSFNLKRTYGTNQADVEALTSSDTDTIREIWGGFSWERRAVVVQVGDYTLAGSMSAMPHAGLENRSEGAWVSGRSAGYGFGYNYDMVKGNNMDGHMDIHFKNSRTHGTNVVQKIHQDMVKKAAEYIATMKLTK
jgi:hypothetical protein